MKIAQPQPIPPTKQTWHQVTWNKLPDDPVDNNLQPLLAEALRESLELARLFLESALIATNFGICATVADKTVVNAPDWVYIADVKPLSELVIRRSYTPNIDGDRPLIALEFISEIEGTEYSINPHYPYGKWYFYERILQVPLYGIFHPKTGTLDLYCLVESRYELQIPNENKHFRIPEINFFLGAWDGRISRVSTAWLRWWDHSGNLLLWGKEIIDQEKLKAEQERQRAEQAESRLQQEQVIRQRLVDRLKAVGVDADLGEG